MGRRSWPPVSNLNLQTRQGILDAFDIFSEASRQDVLASCDSSSTPILWHSQWSCLARSNVAVIADLKEFFQHVYNALETPAQENMCRSLSLPLRSLLGAMEAGKRCMENSQNMPKGWNSLLSWLDEMFLKRGSSDVVDVHLERLLYTSSVVREVLMRSAPDMDDFKSTVVSHTEELCGIWEKMDAGDDIRSAQTLMERIKGGEGGSSDTAVQALLNRIIRKDERNCRQLASFILQKLTWSLQRSQNRVTEISVLPPFLCVDPKGLNKRPRFISEGSGGKVYKSSWLGRRLAEKVVCDPEGNEVFGREVTFQAQAQHPNVMALVCYTKNTSKNEGSLLMELMQQSLHDLMKRRMSDNVDAPFSLLQSVDLMLQIAQGMEYLHNTNVMHRDLKSNNILVSFPGQGAARIGRSYASDVHLKVGDFGSCKLHIGRGRYSTKPIGTTGWMAPELSKVSCKDDGKYMDKADVYSFAIVCFEILTGKGPFHSDQKGIKERVAKGERPQLPITCPPALSCYIQQCWDDDPTKRPTFTQICRMLRYFKACISLAGDDAWLLQPLSTATRNCIDEKGQKQLRRARVINRNVPDVLAIPVEMDCCREVLCPPVTAETKDTCWSFLLELNHIERMIHMVVIPFRSILVEMYCRSP